MRAGNGAVAGAALALDTLLGEPPESLHPTVWMGRTISAFEKRALSRKDPFERAVLGGALAGALPTVSFLLVRAVVRLAPRKARLVVEAALLSTTISMRGLARAAAHVACEMESGDLDAARSRLGEFVGRDTANLSATDVARAAVESVAENTSDGVFAPVLYGFLFGTPGAFAYKAVNTLDSMVGHTAAPYTEFGRAPARLDDLANIIPARLMAVMAAAVSGKPAATFSVARRYGPLTTSPNAGWTEAAFAGALGLRLGGANSYGGVIREGPVLGEGRFPDASDVRRAVGMMYCCCLLLAVTMLFVDRARRG